MFDRGMRHSAFVPHDPGRALRASGRRTLCANLDEIRRNEQHRDAKSHKPIFPYYYDHIKTIADHLHYRATSGQQ